MSTTLRIGALALLLAGCTAEPITQDELRVCATICALHGGLAYVRASAIEFGIEQVVCACADNEGTRLLTRPFVSPQLAATQAETCDGS